MIAALSTETVHASCVAIGGRGVLIGGRSGAGKSDLALRLIDRGAELVSDDYTIATRSGGRLLARAPETIAGKIELRGVGIIQLAYVADVPICLFASIDPLPARLPEQEQRLVAGVPLPTMSISPLEASAPIKLEYALLRFGLPL